MQVINKWKEDFQFEEDIELLTATEDPYHLIVWNDGGVYRQLYTHHSALQSGMDKPDNGMEDLIKIFL